MSMHSQLQKLVQKICWPGQTQATCNSNSRRLVELSIYFTVETLSKNYVIQVKLSQQQKQRVYEAMLTAKERN